MDKYLKPLTKEQAQARSALFTQAKDNLSYSYFLKLSKGESYEGSGTITFDLQQTSPDFFIDYAGISVIELTINGKKVETTDNYESLREKRSLKLPESHLQKGKNIAQIKFKNLYGKDGCGLHSFVDTDGKQYVYSDCEPYHCNRIFPCFDQPDLKGTLTLTLAVPKDWVAIANETVNAEATSKIDAKELLTEEETGNFNLVAFRPTPRISSYLYALMAGPYSEVKCQNPYKNIQMSCYSRESLIPYLKDQAEDIFELTIEGIKFYEQFFGYPFPFTKYDSVFCPEYNQGAMENPGAITFNDRYIWKEATTIDRISARANTIEHELAHMWFGNLVTMKWWNDLWLNESFADFISHFCLSNISSKLTRTKLSDSWVQFFSRKGWGYRDDQKSTTHPIAGDVYNTDHAENIFDGITYSKGAATLKQLLHLIGRENFGKAMEHYFKQYEWSNTTLDDFVGSLQKFYQPTNPKYPSNLSDWKGEWLQIAGLNECIPVWDPLDSGNETKITVIQSAARSDFPTLRHHKMKIALFDESGKVYDSIDVVLENKKETVVVYTGNQKPKALFLNYQDETFIKTMIDGHSLSFFKEKVTSVPDELTRAMIWQSMYNMVKDGKLSGYQFIQTAKGAIEKESSDTCLSSIFTYISASLNFVPNILKDNYLKPELFDVTVRSLANTDKANKNKQILLRDYVIMFASSPEDSKVDNVSKLIEWFDGKNADLKDVELSTANKWSIVSKVYNYSKLDAEAKKAYFNKVADIDKSDKTELMRKKCEALLAEGEERKKLWESFFDKENTTSVHMMGQAMAGYKSSKLTTSEHEKVFFDSLIDVFTNRNNKFASAFYGNLFPKGENLQYYMERIRELLNKAKGLDVLVKSLQGTLDDLELRRRGYLCAAPDLLKVHFNISL